MFLQHAHNRAYARLYPGVRYRAIRMIVYDFDGFEKSREAVGKWLKKGAGMLHTGSICLTKQCLLFHSPIRHFNIACQDFAACAIGVYHVKIAPGIEGIGGVDKNDTGAIGGIVWLQVVGAIGFLG
jgi:hypothetical protein